jgi:hypothetical protein
MEEQPQQTPPTMTPPSVAYRTPPRPPQQHDGLAITSFVLSMCTLLVGALASIPAVITGHISRSRARQEGRAPSGLALAGLIIGYIGIGITALLVVVFVAAAAGRNSGGSGGAGGSGGSRSGGSTASANQTVCSDAQAVANDVSSRADNQTITSDSNTMVNDNNNLNDSSQLSNAVMQYNSDFQAGNYSQAGTDLSAINSICSNLGY